MFLDRASIGAALSSSPSPRDEAIHTAAEEIRERLRAEAANLFAEMERLGVKAATIELIKKLMPPGVEDPLRILAAAAKAIEAAAGTNK